MNYCYVGLIIVLHSTLYTDPIFYSYLPPSNIVYNRNISSINNSSSTSDSPHTEPVITTYQGRQYVIPDIQQLPPTFPPAIINHNSSELRNITPPKTPQLTNPRQPLPPQDAQSPAFAHTFLERTRSFVMSYVDTKKLIGAGIVATAYGAVLAKLIYSKHVISTHKKWSSWKEDIPLEMFAQVEQRVAQELFKEIQQTYAQSHRSACFLSPLVHFITDIEQEAKFLHDFINLHAWLDSMKIHALFPAQEDSIALAYTKIKRLDYYKTIITQWVGEYRVDNVS